MAVDAGLQVVECAPGVHVVAGGEGEGAQLADWEGGSATEAQNQVVEAFVHGVMQDGEFISKFGLRLML